MLLSIQVSKGSCHVKALRYSDTKLPWKGKDYNFTCFRFAAKFIVIVNFLLEFSFEKICPFVYEQWFICYVLNVQCLYTVKKSVFFHIQLGRKNNLADIYQKFIMWLDTRQSSTDNYPGKLQGIDIHIKMAK